MQVQNWRFFVLCDLQIWRLILRKNIAHFFYANSSFIYLFEVICEFTVELRSGNDQIVPKFVLASVTLTFDPWNLCMYITPDIGNYSWKFCDHTMRGTLSKSNMVAAKMTLRTKVTKLLLKRLIPRCMTSYSQENTISVDDFLLSV